ncbi:MAG: hypothetical protein EA414_07900 [Arthrospira sp. PLM2.Bin9]|nr:hypothetical protein [Arthrospira sp. PLM2.Bin9]TVU54221.1 MAG: hypothetical protein EA414_07900 [Arthrospira sp. PLM2.Bin9]
MTILIANLGTSDLTVKLKVDDIIESGYLPIFEREEENIDRCQLTDAELELWQTRNQRIAECLCPELQVEASLHPKYFFSFREITRKIWEDYQPEDDPNGWGDRISPGRILGVIQTARTIFKVEKAYIFVTNQVTPQQPQGHHRDTYYLFPILAKWLAQKQVDIELIPWTIPADIAVNDINQLMRVYGEFFQTHFAVNHPHINDLVLISLKGGTGQMQTALQMQAFSSAIQKQIFIEPKLSVRHIFKGENSDCILTPRWYHLKTQKYQVIQQLLQRWDFDGVRVVIKNWSECLATLQNYDLKDIDNIGNMYRRLQKVEQGLNLAIAYFNLDNDYAKQQVNQSDDLKILSDYYPHPPGQENRRFPKLLNLYTQCCLLWQTDRIADFLTRMGSFYEETLHELIYALQGDKYFDRPEKRGNWILQTASLLGDNQRAAQKFYELEKASENWNLVNAINRGKCLVNQRWVRPLDDRKYGDRFVLPGRPTKLNFVHALLATQGNKPQLDAWEELVKAMASLDYWCVKRNKLIHGAKGISKERMMEVLEEDRQMILESQKSRNFWVDFDIKNSIDSASFPDGFNKSGLTILAAMQILCEKAIVLMEVEPPPSLFFQDKITDYFHPFRQPYYLYSDIKEWVQQLLNQDE